MHHQWLAVGHSIICQNKQVVFGQLFRCSFPWCTLASCLLVNEWSRLEARGSPSGNRNYLQVLKWDKTANMYRKAGAFPWQSIKHPLVHFLWCTMTASCSVWIFCMRFNTVEMITVTTYSVSGCFGSTGKDLISSGQCTVNPYQPQTNPKSVTAPLCILIDTIWCVFLFFGQNA